MTTAVKNQEKKNASHGHGWAFSSFIQPKLKIGRPGDPYEKEADAVADKVMMMPSLGMPAAPAVEEVVTPTMQMSPSFDPAGIQMKCEECEEESIQMTPIGATLMMMAGTGEEDDAIQMKCQQCEEEERLQMKCGQCEEEEKLQMECDQCKKDDYLQPSAVLGSGGEASPGLTQKLRSTQGQGNVLPGNFQKEISRKMGSDFSEVKVHTDTASKEMNRQLGSRAFTYGNDIYFNSGEYDPYSYQGRHLLAHELTHVVQQGAAPGLQDPGGIRMSKPGESLQRYSWDEFVEDIGDGIGALSGAAKQVWDVAHQIASALGVSISVSGTRLSISVPSVQDVCPILPLRFNLPEIGADIPFALAGTPLGPNVAAYGMVGLHVGLTPEISLQVGPCHFSGGRITADLSTASFSASGGGSATLAIGLGAELRVGLRGEVGLVIIIPAGPFPIPIQIPVAGIEAGLAGFGRATASNSFTASGSMSYSSGTFTFSGHSSSTLGLGIDYGLAGYGGIDLLGQNLCTIYWPFLMDHIDSTMSLEQDLDVVINRSGISIDYDASDPVFDPVDYDELPLMLERDMFSDECPLCDFFEYTGLMPSNYGGHWTGHPGGAWPGPLANVYRRDPGIPSGSKCRGACGPDCDTCNTQEEKIVCHDVGNGKHEFWRYPNYTTCNSHQGCRDHDGCYDWCASGGGIASSLIIMPCQRLCDFEAMCHYGFQQAVGWVFGAPPHDQQTHYSDRPEKIGECSGPCQQEEGESGQPVWRICLPENITLFDVRSLREEFPIDPFSVTLFRKGVEIPYIGLGVNLIRVYAFARFVPPPYVQGEIGPAMLSDVCVVYDPASRSYSGEARLSLRGMLSGQIAIRGGLGATALEGKITDCLRISALDGEGSLSATGRIELPLELSNNIVVKCEQGEIQVINSIDFETCLRLAYSLRAHILAKVLGYEVYENSWHLAGGRWQRCWDTNLAVIPITLGVGGSGVAQGMGAALQGLGAGGGPGAANPSAAGTPPSGPAATQAPAERAFPELSIGGIDAVDLLRWLLNDTHSTDQQDEAGTTPALAATNDGDDNDTPANGDPCEGVGEESAKPIGRWDDGVAYHHYSKSTINGDFRPGVERWTNYYTNCRAEAREATGVPDDLNYVTTISYNDATPTYIDDGQYQIRRFTSIIYNISTLANHYTNHTAIPQSLFTTQPLEIFTNDCS